jgi:hypothetical protein
MHSVRLLIGSLVVYVLVACGSAMLDQQQHPQQDAGTQILDALTDPVGEAAGQPVGPIAATENCDKVYMLGGRPYAFAEHAFPGYTAQQLAALQVLLTFNSKIVAGGGVPTGYSQQVGGVGVFVRDGSAAVECGEGTSPAFQSVTFILPQ